MLFCVRWRLQTVVVPFFSTATADAADALPLLRLATRVATIHVPCVRAGSASNGGGAHTQKSVYSHTNGARAVLCPFWAPCVLELENSN